MPEDIETENLIVKNKDGEDREVLTEIIYSKEEVTPRVTDTGDAGIDNKRFEFMVGRKTKRICNKNGGALGN